MSKFDSMRFAEAFGAAVLGAAVYDHVKTNTTNNEIDNVRKFQRSLILATHGNGFTESISHKYLSRITDLSNKDRKLYINSILQPSEQNFDEKLTSLMIYDHALQDEVEWSSTCKIYGLGIPSFIDVIGGAAKGIVRSLEEDGERIRKEREERQKTWHGKIRNLMSW